MKIIHRSKDIQSDVWVDRQILTKRQIERKLYRQIDNWIDKYIQLNRYLDRWVDLLDRQVIVYRQVDNWIYHYWRFIMGQIE